MGRAMRVQVVCIAVFCFLSALAFAQQKKSPVPAKKASATVPKQAMPVELDSVLAGIPAGTTPVVDLSYTISDKLVPWPGDDFTFEAAPKANVKKDGYFTR